MYFKQDSILSLPALELPLDFVSYRFTVLAAVVCPDMNCGDIGVPVSAAELIEEQCDFFAGRCEGGSWFMSK